MQRIARRGTGEEGTAALLAAPRRRTRHQAIWLSKRISEIGRVPGARRELFAVAISSGHTVSIPGDMRVT